MFTPPKIGLIGEQLRLLERRASLSSSWSSDNIASKLELLGLLICRLVEGVTGFFAAM